MGTSEEQGIPKHLPCVAHFHLAGSGAPGKLTEVHEATDASSAQRIQVPSELSFILETHFQCFLYNFMAPPFSL